MLNNLKVYKTLFIISILILVLNIFSIYQQSQMFPINSFENLWLPAFPVFLLWLTAIFLSKKESKWLMLYLLLISPLLIYWIINLTPAIIQPVLIFKISGVLGILIAAVFIIEIILLIQKLTN